MFAPVLAVLCLLAATVDGGVIPNIVGGSDAAANEFPFQGSLQLQVGSSYVHLCGCILYGPNRALTAAHCLTNTASVYRVVFGMLRMATPDGTEQYSSLESYVTHPDFNTNVAGFPNDIAVLRLTTHMDLMSPAVATAFIPPPDSNFDGQSCVVPGWGKESVSGVRPDTLHKVNMDVMTNTACATAWENITGAAILNTHICGYSGTGTSGCDGDFGGPIVCGGNNIAGIMSWVINVCSGPYPTVFSRVSEFYNWLAEQ